MAAIQAAPPASPERGRLEAELTRLYARRVDKVRRWQAAKEVLEAELVALKAALVDYARYEEKKLEEEGRLGDAAPAQQQH